MQNSVSKEFSMLTLDQHPSGRHFLQIPGPSPVPDRILRAMSLPTIDHRGPEFGALGLKVLSGLQQVFQTKHPVVVYPASGTGAWEAALVNVLSPGDAVLMAETGHFATLWKQMAERLGLAPEFLALPGSCAETGLPNAWRHGVPADRIAERLRADSGHAIKAVCVVHNETSTGVTSDIAAVRRAIDAAGHPALLMVDTISGLASADYRHDEWGVDVTVSGSQKGLMLPPGMSFNALSPKAIEASKSARLPKSFWAWDEIVAMNQGLLALHAQHQPAVRAARGAGHAAVEGLDAVFARHPAGPRACARGARLGPADPVRRPGGLLAGADRRRHPEGVDADALRQLIHERFDLSLGTGLGKVKGRMFRIGHLGDCNDLTLMATLAGVEMGLKLGGVELAGSGVAGRDGPLRAHPAPHLRPAPLAAAA
jgi:alanine-glyoxylate transaminase / serine-glyoxylate transaminase / serine-pyruvate transaminase